ncbi:MAG TPA: chloride channel protein [Vicinamibacterales bacterium]|nr:chloride channel protein [Vicinamibacterales bacterium]
MSTPSPVPVAPSLTISPEAARLSRPARPLDQRALMMSGLAVIIGGIAGLVAEGLTLLIYAVTNLSFYGRLSMEHTSPAGNHLGFWVVIPPVVGGLIVGVMARFGSKAIRGHGIPEAMEQIVLNKSRIPARVALLKPLSAAIAIGTGGPFGAEGPIIATGGALGSLIGQSIAITAIERRTLLAAGAAAGMAATFGAPVAAVLLALEFLLYELRARSIIPVALASTVATAVRWSFHGSEPVFAMLNLAQPGGAAIAGYIALGAFTGFVAIGVTRLLYAVEDGFEELPIHWMWWPALGAVAVGVIGWISPHTLGVGYDNITNILSGTLTWQVLAALAFWKFLSWVISLASGTSGGTLAPLFTVGGAVGALVGTAAAHFIPSAGFDPRIAALVGMASMFAGASHTLLTWVVFSFETTRQPLSLLPILGGAAAAYLVAGLGMRDSIMTQKISRRGVPLVMGPEVDFLRIQTVRQWATSPVVTIAADSTIAAARAALGRVKHQGFPVLDGEQRMVGVITRREIEEPGLDESALVRSLLTRTPVATFDDVSLREAADIMVDQGVGRLPVVTKGEPTKVAGIITRSDLLRAHGPRLEDANHREPSRFASRPKKSV